jgi:hypothetical protein
MPFPDSSAGLLLSRALDLSRSSGSLLLDPSILKGLPLLLLRRAFKSYDVDLLPEAGVAHTRRLPLSNLL